MLHRFFFFGCVIVFFSVAFRIFRFARYSAVFRPCIALLIRLFLSNDA